MKDTAALDVYRLGVQPYEPVWQAMQRYTDTRTAEDRDQLWLLEHAPVFTQGQAGKPEHLLDTGDIPVVQADRGGQVTYHGPGQMIGYVMLDLKRQKFGVRALVTALERSVIASLAWHGIEAYARPDAPGVYVTQDGNMAKIASLGLRVRRGCSFHGIAYNIDMDLAPFHRINPCGYAGMPMTHLRALLPEARQLDMQEETNRWLNCLTHALSGHDEPMLWRDCGDSPKELSNLSTTS